MKLWEALKALDENPEKEFGCAGMRLTRDLGAYRFINVVTEERAFYMGACNDWQEIKKPVTWQEALEAWANGKTITCVFRGSKYTYLGVSPSLITNRGQSPLAKPEISDGTWYIGEETK